MPPSQLHTVELYLDDVAYTRSIGIYREISVHELKQLICATFHIPRNIDIVGIFENEGDTNNTNPIIPLSFLSHNPSTIDSDSKYQIITNYGFSRRKSFGEQLKGWIKFIAKNIPICLAIIFGALLSLIILVFATHKIFTCFIRTGLQRIYRNGPNVRILHADLGFWNGKDIAIICSEMTGQSSEFWTKNYLECNQLYEQKESGFVVLFETIIVVYLSFKILKIFTDLLTQKIRK